MLGRAQLEIHGEFGIGFQLRESSFAACVLMAAAGIMGTPFS